jgi:glycerophosphoryl diester phosphodiesterase
MEARPFYLIAHKCNSPAEVEKAIRDGANAVECDLQYKPSKNVFVVNHDDVNNREEDDLTTYLKEVKKNAALALIIFDCKKSVASKPEIALNLLNTIKTELPYDTGINIIISVANYENKNFFRDIIDKLEEKSGVAIDQEDDPTILLNHFGLLEKNYCYANGLSTDNDFVDWGATVLGFKEKLRRSIIQALLHKVEYKIKLVYVWTLLDKNLMKSYLCMGVDGILVDSVTDLVEVLNEKEFKNSVKLATRNDNAFKLPLPSTYKIVVKTGDRNDAGTNANVYITLYGDRNSCEHLLNTPDHNDFERGKEDEFLITTVADLGNLKQVQIRHDNDRPKPGWFLDWIKVEKDNQSWDFPCNRWLAKDEDDDEIKRTLKVNNAAR